jgi:hypothetical protein
MKNSGTSGDTIGRPLPVEEGAVEEGLDAEAVADVAGDTDSLSDCSVEAGFREVIKVWICSRVRGPRR